jgi:hypothetical protein
MKFWFPHARIFLISTLAIALLGGCVSSPPDNLARMKLSMTSKLTAQCYWEHKGERYVFGSAPVWSACRCWARAAVDVNFSRTAGSVGGE